MKICLDIRSTLKSTSTGLGKFTMTLVKALNLASSNLNLVLYHEKRMFDFKKKVPQFKEKNISYINGYKNKDIKADIYVSSSYDYNPPTEGKFIQIIHDLIPLAASQFSSEDAKNILLKLLPVRLNRADAVVCISENTMNDLAKFYPSSKSKTSVIYNAIDPAFNNIEDKEKLKNRLRKLGINNNYLLFVSAIELRKNLLSLLRAFSFIKDRYPNLRLVVAGKKVKGYNEIDEFTKKGRYKKDIIYLGYVKQKDLIYLYNGAEIFVYPSFYEGFGLPIMEAFSCGVPVITSNLSSMKEIAEGASELINPYNPNSIAESISRILEDENYRRELIDKGFRRAAHFSIKKMGREYVNLFNNVIV